MNKTLNTLLFLSLSMLMAILMTGIISGELNPPVYWIGVISILLSIVMSAEIAFRELEKFN
jgi:4-hydroxybenzoate polyprenyltransferase